MTEILPPALRLPDPGPEVRALARRHAKANGPLMVLVTKLGNRIEDQLAHLPPQVRARIEKTTTVALEKALSVAQLGRHAPDFGPRAAPALAALTG
ncbi:MAG: staphylolytic protease PREPROENZYME LASA, partial [Paracoccaceae bacterium]|nr:staphylolytic protease PREPROENZYME LASA [Paracoccaceae bacterium]